MFQEYDTLNDCNEKESEEFYISWMKFYNRIGTGTVPPFIGIAFSRFHFCRGSRSRRNSLRMGYVHGIGHQVPGIWTPGTDSTRQYGKSSRFLTVPHLQSFRRLYRHLYRSTENGTRTAGWYESWKRNGSESPSQEGKDSVREAVARLSSALALAFALPLPLPLERTCGHLDVKVSLSYTVDRNCVYPLPAFSSRRLLAIDVRCHRNVFRPIVKSAYLLYDFIWEVLQPLCLHAAKRKKKNQCWLLCIRIIVRVNLSRHTQYFTIARCNPPLYIYPLLSFIINLNNKNCSSIVSFTLLTFFSSIQSTVIRVILALRRFKKKDEALRRRKEK